MTERLNELMLMLMFVLNEAIDQLVMAKIVLYMSIC